MPTELPKTAGVVVPGTETTQLPADGTNPQLEARMLSVRGVGGQLVDIQGKSVHRILGLSGDHVLPHVNGPFRYVLVWPDVDPWATTVTVDAPDGYRFLDVPIG